MLNYADYASFAVVKAHIWTSLECDSISTAAPHFYTVNCVSGNPLVLFIFHFKFIHFRSMNLSVNALEK